MAAAAASCHEIPGDGTSLLRAARARAWSARLGCALELAVLTVLPGAVHSTCAV